VHALLVSRHGVAMENGALGWEWDGMGMEIGERDGSRSSVCIFVGSEWLVGGGGGGGCTFDCGQRVELLGACGIRSSLPLLLVVIWVTQIGWFVRHGWWSCVTRMGEAISHPNLFVYKCIYVYTMIYSSSSVFSLH
jgi:hypothetical protein